MRISTFLIAIAAFAFVVSCGKATTESETKRWEASKKTLETLGAKYPGFKPALNQVLVEATKVWDAAQNVSGEEAQVEAMRGANGAARPSFVSKLDGMQDACEALKDMCTEATQAGGADEADKQALSNARNEANITLNNVEGMLKSGTAKTPTEAEAIINEADKQLESAMARVKKVMDGVKSKKDDAKAASDTAAAKTQAAEEAKNPIKCGHCGSMNAHDALKCSGCGAPVEK